MSKIGKKPIPVPEGVTVILDKNLIKIKGPKGELEYIFSEFIKIKNKENQIIISLLDENKKNIRGLSRTLISNMVEGVVNGYEKKLLVIGVGYGAKLEGNKLILSIGFSHKVKYDIPSNIKVSVEQDPKGNSIITLQSIDKQYLGEVTAKIRSLKTPEPYKGKGIRYINEFVKLKAGKSAKK